MLLPPSESFKEAEKIGLPVPAWSEDLTIEPPAYVKADVPLPHKTERGAVIRAESEEELRKAYERIKERFGKAIVQKEVKGDLEVLVSLKEDGVFGKVLVLAFGGVLASVVKESAVTPCPLCKGSLAKKLEGRKLSIITKGFRGKKLDVDCLFGVMERLCEADAKVFEVNPLVLSRSGCWAVDVKVWK